MKNFVQKIIKMNMLDEDYVNYYIAFEAAGFPGASSSTDAVNIAYEKISWNIRQKYLGCKKSLTFRVQN